MIFDKRVELRPVEYDFDGFVDAIRHSYWVHTEFNLTGDINDFKTVTHLEQNAMKNAMLAIAQIEVSVKTFWGDIYKRISKPEVGGVGYTFAECEVRHKDAYAFLLEVLGLNSEFSKITSIPAIQDRIDYLQEYLDGIKGNNNKEYTRSILLFSLFVEYISLFGQFLIMMSFNKEKNKFKGVSNIVEATSKEEQIHGMFGIQLINIIKEEYPEWFTNEFKEEIYAASIKAMKAENKILDWIFEAGELDFLSKNTIKNFLMDRFNQSLQSINFDPIFDVDKNEVEKTKWFAEEVIASKHYDFFNKRPTSYSKKTKSITEDDLF